MVWAFLIGFLLTCCWDDGVLGCWATRQLDPPTWTGAATKVHYLGSYLHLALLESTHASDEPGRVLPAGRSVSNSSRVGSEAPWRCRHPGRRLPVLHQTAWSRGTPRPPRGQAGRTPLWIPPRCLEAAWTRHTCPAVPPCRRTPVGGRSVECGGVESAGLTRGGRTVGTHQHSAMVWLTRVIFSCSHSDTRSGQRSCQ